MGGNFSIMDRLRLAFEVISRWETLATLGAFIVFWLIVRYVADPWRHSGGSRPSLRFRRPSGKTPELPAAESESMDEVEEDELPD